VLAAAVTIQIVEAYVLFPRFMGKEAGIHPLTCLLALVAFGTLLGVVGCFLAIPIALILQLSFERIVVKQRDDRAGMPAGRERGDVLQYDARRLVDDARRVGESPAVIGDAALHALTEEIEAIASELDRILPEQPMRSEAEVAA
jgi:hypothetical protein